MSFFSGLWNGVKKVGSAVGGVVKKAATPLLSFAAGMVPGIGPFLSKGVDSLGNALLGDTADPNSDAGQADPSSSPVSNIVGQFMGRPIGFGTSAVVQAAANAVTMADDEPVATDDSTTGNRQGFLGIGDGKPGVFGIGTGKGKARKAAEAAAQAAGQSPKAVKAAGDAAAAAATNGGSSGEGTSPWLIIGAGILALLAL